MKKYRIKRKFVIMEECYMYVIQKRVIFGFYRNLADFYAKDVAENCLHNLRFAESKGVLK